MILRKELVEIALKWESKFGIAPEIMSRVAEYDVARLVGFSKSKYSAYMQNVSAVQKGYDFKYKKKRYQVKSARPSGKKGSKITLVHNVSNYEWDYFVWIRYNEKYEKQEAWLFSREKYKSLFENKKRLNPSDMRKYGKNLFHNNIGGSK